MSVSSWGESAYGSGDNYAGCVALACTGATFGATVWVSWPAPALSPCYWNVGNYHATDGAP